ncbi:GAF domain-containing protein [Aerosakkonemataceae cyanobacterium BLCC-F154]|uniref:histidine kinase n=1 Tax=Floridaenema fluviatile BLCC-F154 TaxID=3153640 RepID=A0ABV4YFR2_9CYAN
MRVAVGMVSPENNLFLGLNGVTPQAREQQRLIALTESGLLQAENIPIFDEATQTAAHFLDAPICILGIMDRERQVFKSAVGLSRLGLMNQLAASRQLLRSESFCHHVVESQRVVLINDAPTDPVFAKSVLVQHYGIHAYLGVPLLTASGHCLGTLAVMDKIARNFSSKDIEFLELMARWIMSEFERSRLQTSTEPSGVMVNLNTQVISPSQPNEQLAANQIQVKLLGQITQELRTPLTSVLGMASVLGREIYGPLTKKQREYLEIIQNSGQYLLSLVNEILALGELNADDSRLSLSATDIEMLCQQASNCLEEAANRRGQKIRVSVEPGNRIWQLDKEKVRQMLYHLVSSLLKTADTGCVVRIHVSRKNQGLNIAVWVSHPWLGDSLPNVESYLCQSSTKAIPVRSESLPSVAGDEETWSTLAIPSEEDTSQIDSSALADFSHLDDRLVGASEEVEISAQPLNGESAENLGLLLSCHLAQMQGGHISIQGSPESGYRYVILLPKVKAVDE